MTLFSVPEPEPESLPPWVVANRRLLENLGHDMDAPAFAPNSPAAKEPFLATTFDGATYDPELDQERLEGQLGRVYDAMKDGRWRTLWEIAERCAARDTQAAISARLRDLRKEKWGAYQIERRRRSLPLSSAVWEYRVGAKGAGTPNERRCPHCAELEAEIAELLEMLAK